MNDGLKSFMTNMGVLCESWVIVYKNFITLGMDPKEAIEHTQAFMTTIVAATTQNGGNKA